MRPNRVTSSVAVTMLAVLTAAMLLSACSLNTAKVTQRVPKTEDNPSGQRTLVAGIGTELILPDGTTIRPCKWYVETMAEVFKYTIGECLKIGGEKFATRALETATSVSAASQ